MKQRITLLLAMVSPGLAQQVERQELRPAELQEYDDFGQGLSMDGAWLAVGAPNHPAPFNAEGAVYLYKRVAGEYVFRQKVTHQNPLVGDGLGYTVLLRGEELFGYRQRIPGSDDFRGMVIVFEHGASGWTETQRLEPAGIGTHSLFGWRMATNGESLLVAGPGHDADGNGGASNLGAVFAYERGPSGWEEVQVIEPNAQSWSWFGADVAMDGDRAAIGCRGGLAGYTIFLYERVQGVWVETAQIPHPSNLPPGDSGFGKVLDLSGDFLAVGANYFVDPINGRVLMYRETSPGNWIQEATLLPADGHTTDHFGEAVCLRGSELVVGAPRAMEGGLVRGASYLFQRSSTGNWEQVAKLIEAPKPGYPPGSEIWGNEVDFQRGVVVVGSHFAHDANGVWTGEADVHLWPQGASYCSAEPHSDGWPAFSYAQGSRKVAQHDFELWASKLPAHVPGFFLASRVQANLPHAGGSSGTLCLGMPLARFRNQVFSSGPWGWATIDVDVDAIPLGPPVPILPGETWNFQAWFRDGATSNFTLPTTVTFE